MAVKASAEVTVFDQTDADALVMWYQLTTSATKPDSPATTPSGWSKSEPAVDTTQTTYLYTCLQTVWKDGSCTWGEVQLDSSYEAAKQAYNRAVAAGEAVDGIKIGGRNLARSEPSAYAKNAYLAYVIPTTISVRELSVGDSVTIQLWGVEVDANSSGVRVYWGGGHRDYTGSMTPDENGYVCHTHVISEADYAHGTAANKFVHVYHFANGHSGASLSVERWKIEVGNKATDWTPAPEDVDDLVSSVQQIAQSALDDSVEYIEGTQTAKTGAWTGVTRDAALAEGKKIAYRLPYAGNGNATLNLTLSGGGTTGAKAVYLGTTRMTTHFGAGSIIQMVYDGASWRATSIPNSNNYDRRLHNNYVVAAADLMDYSICAGTSEGYRTIAASLAFDLSYPVLYLAAANASGQSYAVAAGAQTAAMYEALPSVNPANTAAVQGAAENAMLYLKGKIAGNTFTVAPTNFLTCVAPTSEDGYVYMPLGVYANNSTTAVYFSTSRDLYAYLDGKFRQVTPTEVVASQRIYYRASVSTTTPDTAITKPTAWVTQNGDKRAANLTTAANWSTKPTSMAPSTAEGETKYPYLYTCEQRERLDGTLAYTKVVLDDSAVVVDGGNIISNSVTANEIDATNLHVAAANVDGKLTAGQIEVDSITIGQSQVTGLEDALDATGPWYAECTTAAATADKVATITPATTNFALANGVVVHVKFTVTSSAAVANLTLNVNGTGAKPVRAVRNGAYANLAHHPQANTTYEFFYNGTYWVMQENYNADTYNRTRYQAAIKVLAKPTGTWRLLCGTASGYRQIAASVAFDLAYPILAVSAQPEANTTTDTGYLCVNALNFSNVASIQSGAANKTVYLKGQVSGNTFTCAASNVFTTVVPTSDDGYCYIPLGVMTSATVGYFESSSQLYAYKDGAFGPVSIREASAAAKTATNYIATVDNDGIMVHPQGDSTSGWKIASAIELLKSGASYIKAWLDGAVAKVRIGLETAGHILIDNDSVDVMNGTDNIASFGEMSRIGQAESSHMEQTAGSTKFFGTSGTNELLSINTRARGSDIAFHGGTEWIVALPGDITIGAENQTSTSVASLTASHGDTIGYASDLVLKGGDVGNIELSTFDPESMRAKGLQMDASTDIASLDYDLHLLGDSDIDVTGEHPSSAKYFGSILGYDGAGNRVFYSQTAHQVSGNVYRSFVCQRPVNGTNTGNGFYLHVAEDGTKSVTFTSGAKAAWREALGMSGSMDGCDTKAIFTGVSVAKGGTIGTNADVFNYRFFYVTLSGSGGRCIGYRSGSASSAGSIIAVGGYDNGSTTYVFHVTIAVSTAGKLTVTAASSHTLTSSGSTGTALNVTAIYGIH